MLLTVLLLPLRLLWFAVGLVVKIVFLPIKAIAAGLMLQLALLVGFVAVLAVLAYFVYQWLA